MEKLESAARKKMRRGRLRKMILEAVMTADELHTSLLRRRLNDSLELLEEPLYPRRNEIINRACRHLVAQGFLKRCDGGMKLTKKGEVEIRALKMRDFKFKRPRKWDRKWRMLIFDIPEDQKPLREKIRRTLTAIGFRQLQRSVWIFPYDCEDIVALVKADFDVGGDMLYIIADAVENDHGYRELFDLRQG